MKLKAVSGIMLILFLASTLSSTLAVAADKKSTTYVSGYIPINIDSTPPVAIFTYEPFEPVGGETVTFNASESYDPDGYIVNYAWLFGDVNITVNETDPITEHVYSGGRPGTVVEYQVMLTVTDDDGLTETTLEPIKVRYLDVRLPTDISISLSSSTSYLRFEVEINGNLTCNGVGLSGAPIRLDYSVVGGAGWYDITVVNTVSDGSYSAVWMPSATANYLVRATWEGNDTYKQTETTVNLAVIPFEEQTVFSVESNSTISGLAFNTTDWTLSFIATGPNGTVGCTKITVTKSLVENIANIRVYLDGNQLEYSITSMDDSWLLTFNYMHSAHQIAVDLDINIIPEFSSIIILAPFVFFTLIAVALTKKNKRIGFTNP